jgi:sugar lactone lactonase YvrE
MDSLMKIKHYLLTIVFLLSSITAYSAQARLLVTLPNSVNSPASMALDKEENIYFTSPNFHNETFMQDGLLDKPAMPAIGKVDKQGKFSAWYTFQQADLEASTGKIAPMGIAFGPDGNLYVADLQLWFNNGKYKSRVLKLTLDKGKVVKVQVVATGFMFPNALAWRGNDLFVSDTVLSETLENGKQLSGVYKINLQQLDATHPAKVLPYDKTRPNPYLFEVFHSDASLKFGANGLAIDEKGNLYTGIMEDGTIFKTAMDKDNNKLTTTLFAKGFIATDGMAWDKRTNKLYVADLFANAVYSVDSQGNTVELAKNGDTDGKDGQLDAPAEVIVRGKQVIATNFDAVFDSPKMVNTTADAPSTLSVIDIK